jgi:hypothetical protein
MHTSRATSRIVTALIIGTVIGLPGAAVRTARARAAHVAQLGSCAVVGTYRVGPRVLPLAGAARGRAGVQTRAPGPPSHGPALASPVGQLRGTLVIRAYTGCGGATLGSFALHRTPVGPPLYRSRRVPPALPQPGLISASGHFVQDPMHPRDATYVLVSATITLARLRPQHGLPCSTLTGCPSVMVITSTATFRDVTGYLQVPSPAGQRATLSFLPPPMASADVAPTALVLQGWRGTAVPRLLPMSGPSAGARRAVHARAASS